MITPYYLNDHKSRVRHLQDELWKEKEPLKQLPLLDELSSHLAAINPAEGEELARKQIHIADSLEENYWKMKGYIRLAHAYLNRSMYREGGEALEKAWRLLEELPDDCTEKAPVYRMTGQIDRDMGRMQDAMAMLRGALGYSRQANDEGETGATLVELGSLYTDMGCYGEAIRIVAEALRIHERQSCRSGIAAGLAEIGKIFAAIEDHEEALHHYQRALALHREAGNRHGEAETCVAVGMTQANQGDYEAALQSYNLSTSISRELGDDELLAQSLTGLARVSRLGGSYTEGLAFLQEAGEKVEREIVRGEVLMELGELHIARGEYEVGAVVLHEALEIFKEAELSPKLLRVHQLLARSCEENQDLDSSFEHYKLFMNLKEKLVNADVQRVIISHYYNGQLRLVEGEKEKDQRKTQQLEERAERYAEEFASLSDHIVRNDSLLGQLRKRLLALKEADVHAASLVNDIIYRIEHDARSVDGWNQFEKQLQKIDGRFLYKLTSLFPSLTPAETRICSLLKINMSSQEIAEVLSLSDQTIATHRKRIRKKMGLKGRENLVRKIADI